MNFHANLRLAAEGSLLAVAPRSAALAMRKVLNLVIIDWGRLRIRPSRWSGAKQASPTRRS